MSFAGVFLNSPAMGALGALHAARGEVTPGGYYGPKFLGELRGPSFGLFPSKQARDPQLSKRLWELSVAMTGIDPGI